MNRRNMNAGGILMSNPKFSVGNFSNDNEQAKRKKLRREMIFGQKTPGNPNANYFAKV